MLNFVMILIIQLIKCGDMAVCKKKRFLMNLANESRVQLSEIKICK